MWVVNDHAAGQEGLTVRVKDDRRVVGDEVTADAAGLTGQVHRRRQPQQRASTGRERCRIATGTPPITSHSASPATARHNHSPAPPTRVRQRSSGPTAALRPR